jgi:hypothetical protein
MVVAMDEQTTTDARAVLRNQAILNVLSLTFPSTEVIRREGGWVSSLTDSAAEKVVDAVLNAVDWQARQE